MERADVDRHDRATAAFIDRLSRRIEDAVASVTPPTPATKRQRYRNTTANRSEPRPAS
jgi:hypothetical protein